MVYLDSDRTCWFLHHACPRCFCTCEYDLGARPSGDYTGELRCPNCGLMEWLWDNDGVRPRGYHPVAPKEQTGYFIDNSSGGYRTPAKIWIPPGPGKEVRTWLSRFKAVFTSQ